MREIWPLSKDTIFELGYITSVYIHKPPADFSSEKKLPVLYVHGIQSHPSWFFGSAMALAEAGHTVYQVTRRGSGDNTKSKGHAFNARELYSDIGVCIHEILGRENVTRVHLVGVSWGGKLIADYAARQKKKDQGKIASVSLLAPGIVSLVDVSLITKLVVFLCKLIEPVLGLAILFLIYVFKNLGELTILLGLFALFVPLIAKSWINLIGFRIPLNDPELFTNNPAMQDYLRQDEFQLHKVTAQFMYVSRRIDWSLKFAKADSISVPTTLILASDDKIIDNDETERIVRKLAGDNLKVVRLQGSHTLEFEANPIPFFHEVVQAVARGES